MWHEHCREVVSEVVKTCEHQFSLGELQRASEGESYPSRDEVYYTFLSLLFVGLVWNANPSLGVPA